MDGISADSSMDATLRDKAAEFAKKFAPNISTPQELNDILRLMSKSMIECMLQAEMDVRLSEDGAARIAQGTTPGSASAAPHRRRACPRPALCRPGKS
jgi:hypothetical protein